MIFFVCIKANVYGQKKVEFDYPDDISDSARKSFAKNINQGQVLYKISCGKCHTRMEGKKEIIPDFSLPQLLDYEMRMYQEHSDQLDDSHVSDDEMTKIILFLRYKKRSGVTVRPPSVL